MKHGENDFYIGIDIGAYNTVISYIDQGSGQAVILDPSGGFGQSSVLSYMAKDDFGGWLIGEEAVEHEEAFQIDAKVLEKSDVLAAYILALLEHVFNVNPIAEIKGLVISSSMVSVAINEKALSADLKDHPMCRHLKECRIVKNEAVLMAYLDKLKKTQGSLTYTVVDFGHTAFRCYTIAKKESYKVDLLSHCDQLSGQRLLETLESFFLQAYLDHIGEEGSSDQVDVWIRQLVKTYFPYIFKSYKEQKALRVTYNFAYPPFQLKVETQTLNQLIQPLEERLLVLLKAFSMDFQSTEVVVVGGGMRMNWPLHLLNAQTIPIALEEVEAYAKGAAFVASMPKWEMNITYSDTLMKDYGLIDSGGQFIVLGRKGQGFKDQFDSVYITMSDEDDKCLTLYHRSEEAKPEAEKTFTCVSDGLEELYNMRVHLLFDDEQRPDLAIRYLPL